MGIPHSCLDHPGLLGNDAGPGRLQRRANRESPYGGGAGHSDPGPRGGVKHTRAGSGPGVGPNASATPGTAAHLPTGAHVNPDHRVNSDAPAHANTNTYANSCSDSNSRAHAYAFAHGHQHSSPHSYSRSYAYGLSYGHIHSYSDSYACRGRLWPAILRCWLRLCQAIRPGLILSVTV